MRSAIASATAVLPEAVGPNTAITVTKAPVSVPPLWGTPAHHPLTSLIPDFARVARELCRFWDVLSGDQ